METDDQFIIQPGILSPEKDYTAFVAVYERIKEAGDLQNLFWGKPNSESMSFLDFYGMFSTMAANVCAVMIRGSDLLGVITIHDIFMHEGEIYRCYAGIWVVPELRRGDRSLYMIRQAIAYLHASLKVKYVYAITPWQHVMNMLSQSGMNSTGFLPEYHIINNEYVDVEIFYSENSQIQHMVMNGLMDMGWGSRDITSWDASIFEDG